MVEAAKYLKKSFIVISLLLCLIGLQSVFAQTKFDEYVNISTDDETARLDNFIIELGNNPTAKVYFVIYSGENRIRIGNLLPYIEGVKTHFGYRNLNTDRVSFIIAKGKRIFTREIWIVEKSDEMQKIEEADLDLNGLTEDYLYATQCIECEPAEPHLSTGKIDWNLLAETLRKKTEYRVLIQLGKNSQRYDSDKEKMMNAKEVAKDLRNWFSTKYKIDKNRLCYKIVKEGFAKIYIIPKKK